MKKLIKIFTSVLLLSACSEHDVLIENEDSQSEKAVQSEIRTIDEAYDIAAKAISWIGDGESRTSVRLLPSKRDIKVVMNNKSRSGESSDTLMYVVNFEDEQGFAIIPANRTMPELLAVTENGSYDPETGSEVEPFQEYMDNAVNTLASNYVKEGIELPVLMREVMFVDTTYTYAVEPLANYYWGQTGYEGKYCRNKYSGCGPLSMAMTMAYFGHPTSFAFSAGDNSTVSLNWQDIRQHNAFYDVYNGNVFIDCVDNVPQIAKESLGKLCRQIGKVAGSSYIVGDTPTPYSNFISTLRNFGYTVSNKIDYYSGAEGDYLGHNYLMIACASREPNKSHAWVIDGYKYVHYERWRYERDNDPRMFQPGEWELISHSHTVNYYAHFNWGFRGYYNGYFLSTRWQIENGVEYDFQHAIVDSLHYDMDKQFITITR